MEKTADIAETWTDTPTAGEPRRSRNLIVGILLVLFSMIPLVLWPEDVSWCIDEPRLVAAAWHANNAGQLAAHGLYGNFGVCYGPVPTQVYQLLLHITHDPYTFVVLRALLTGTITAASLLWLGRTLNLPIWFAAAVMVAPQITNHHRVLWDASFTIPLCTLALAAFANFIRTRRPWPLRIAVVTAMELPLIHPQALPVALPILGYLLWKHRADLWKDRRGLLWTVGILLALNAKYLCVAGFNVVWRLTHSTATSYPGVGSRLASALAPFFGGNLLGGYEVFEHTEKGYIFTQKMSGPTGPGWLVATATWAARLVFPLIWIGIGSALWRVRGALGRIYATTNSTSDTVIFVGVAGLLLQAIIFGCLRIPIGLQYYFGTFSLHVLFAWLGVDALRRIRLGLLVGGIFGIGCAYLTAGSAWTTHHHGYNSPSWPTMRNAVELTRALNLYQDSAAYTDIEFFKKYPQPLRTVRLLIPPTDLKSAKQSGRLLLTYKEVNGTKTGEMIVKEYEGPNPPPGAVSLDITPLPEGWVPDPSTW